MNVLCWIRPPKESHEYM